MVGYHLATTCQYYGPLFAHNCFAFESVIGDLLTLKTTSHKYQNQMLSINGKQQMLEYMTSKIHQIDNKIQHLMTNIEISIPNIPKR